MSEISKFRSDIALIRMHHGIRVMCEVIAADKPFSTGIWSSDLDTFVTEQTEECEIKPDECLASGNHRHPCGTAACAVGWMAQDPWHNRQGLRLGIDEDGTLQPFCRNYENKILAGWNAVEAYFQISRKEARSLFGYATETGRDTASAVLARMLAFFGPAMERHLDARSDIPF